MWVLSLLTYSVKTDKLRTSSKYIKFVCITSNSWILHLHFDMQYTDTVMRYLCAKLPMSVCNASLVTALKQKATENFHVNATLSLSF